MAAQPLYSIVPILPPAGSGAYALGGLGINDLGEVVGHYSRYADASGNNQIRSFHYADGKGTTDAWPDAWTSFAKGINNRGQIALYGGESHRTAQAYRYTPGVGYEFLSTFGGQVTEADAINAVGQVTGFSEGPDERISVYRYSDDAGLENLGSTFSNSRGYGINDHGWVVGWGDGRAFLYRDSQGILDLGPGAAYGINNSGTVVGSAFTPFGTTEAFVYVDGQIKLLEQLAGAGYSLLTDINDQGQAVGLGHVVVDLRVEQHAFLWTETDGLKDLNALLPENSGWTLVSAAEINELGQITGQGVFNGMPLAYRLDPIPEPGTWALLGLGALVAWIWRQRRR